MKKKVLVIGATGSIGSPLVNYLIQKGETIKAATRNPERYTRKPNVEVVGFDYDQPATFQSVLADVNRVFMITKPTDSKPAKTLRPFIEQAKAAAVHHIVLVTSLRLGGGSKKRQGFGQLEKEVKASGINYTILRPGWFMSLFIEGFILSMIRHKSGIYLPAGNARISLIDPCDIAAVAAQALCEEAHQGQVYALTGGQALTFREMATIISTEIKQPVAYTDVSLDTLRQIIDEVGGYPGPLDLIERVFAHVKKGEAALISPVVAEVLGRPPRSFAQFVHEHAAVWAPEAEEV